MKRFFFLLSAVVVSLTMAAQMQVWSNGTIIFSHDQTDVDSISFGSPMQVRANATSSSITSLTGCVYVSTPAGGNNGCLDALFFLDGTTGYYGYNYQGETTNTYDYHNKLITFTYTITDDDITLSMGGRTIPGKIIGKNGLVFINFTLSSYDNKYYPAVFINLNR